MRRLQRGDDALRTRQRTEGAQGIGVGTGGVARAPGFLEPGVLGTYAGLIQSRRDRVTVTDLPFVVLQRKAVRAVENPRPAALQRRAVPARLEALPRRLDAQQRDVPIGK